MARKKPVVFTSSSTWSGGAADSAVASGYAANTDGVTMFTPLVGALRAEDRRHRQLVWVPVVQLAVRGGIQPRELGMHRRRVRLERRTLELRKARAKHDAGRGLRLRTGAGGLHGLFRGLRRAGVRCRLLRRECSWCCVSRQVSCGGQGVIAATAGKGQHFVGAAGVEHVRRREPRLARHRHAQRHVVQPRDRVCIGAQLHCHAGIARGAGTSASPGPAGAGSAFSSTATPSRAACASTAGRSMANASRVSSSRPGWDGR